MMKSFVLSCCILLTSIFGFASEEMPATKTASSLEQTSTRVDAPSTEQVAHINNAATLMNETSDTKTLELKAKSEEEIPLNIETHQKSAETTTTSTRILMTAVILFALMATTYYFVRKYKLSNKINKSNMQIKVLSQHHLGPKKSLAIIRVAGESILIGVTDSNISMIKSLSLIDDEVPTEVPVTFSETMSTAAKTTTQSAPAGASALSTAMTTTSNTFATDELEEEFSFAGIKDTVSKKLKSMRSL